MSGVTEIRSAMRHIWREYMVSILISLTMLVYVLLKREAADPYILLGGTLVAWLIPAVRSFRSRSVDSKCLSLVENCHPEPPIAVDGLVDSVGELTHVLVDELQRSIADMTRLNDLISDSARMLHSSFQVLAREVEERYCAEAQRESSVTVAQAGDITNTERRLDHAPVTTYINDAVHALQYEDISVQLIEQIAVRMERLVQLVKVIEPVVEVASVTGSDHLAERLLVARRATRILMAELRSQSSIRVANDVTEAGSAELF